ncbi:MAG: ABC transporter substrate-binding protein [Culicoidibacterales bacterium]
MKKILSLCLVTILVIALSACGVTGSGKTEVSIFQFKVENESGLLKAADAYMVANPSVSIKINTVGGGADYGAALRTEFTGGKAPTIFNIGGPQDVNDWINNVEDLSNTDLSKKAFKGLNEPVTKAGKVYGLPFNQEGYGLIYNKKIFEKAGIKPETITTFSALEEAVKTLTAKKAELGIDGAFSVAGKETWITGLHMSNSFLATEFGSINKAMEAKTVNFAQNDAFKALVDLQINNANTEPKNLNTVDYTAQVETSFSQGKVAIIHQGNWIYSNIEQTNPTLAKEIGLLPVPVKGGIEDNIFVGVPMFWAVNKEKKDPEKQAAIDFLTWLYTDPAGQEIVVNDLGFIPAYEGFTHQPADPLAKEVLRYAKASKTSPWVFMGYPTDWGMGTLGTEMQNYFSGEKTWEQVIAAAKQKWESDRKAA